MQGSRLRLASEMLTLISSLQRNAEAAFQELSITAAHLATVVRLSDLHKDPFDRILTAQAMSEPLRFLTAYVVLNACSELVELVWCVRCGRELFAELANTQSVLHRSHNCWIVIVCSHLGVVSVMI